MTSNTNKENTANKANKELLSAVQNWFTDHNITVLNVITASMIAVENIIKQQIYIDDKLKTAKDLAPKILDLLVKYNKISIQESHTLKLELQLKENLFDEFAMIVSDLTNNPEFINSGKWVKNTRCSRLGSRCFPCWGI